MPWWGKVLLGCGIGCAVLGAGVGVLFLVGAWWLITPGAQIATDQVVAPEAVSVVHFSGEKNLEGLTRLAGIFFAAANEEQWRLTRERLPESVRWLEPFARMQEAQTGQGIGLWLPREATLAIVPGDGDTRRVILAANLRSFVRPIRTLFVRSDARPERVEKRGGVEIIHREGGDAICFAGGTLLWVSEPSALDPVLRRAAAKSPPERPAFLPAARYDDWRSGWSLAVFADGRDERMRGLVAGLLQWTGDEDTGAPTIGEPAPSLGYLAAGARLATADRMEAELAFAAPDAVSQSLWRRLIDSFLAREAQVAQAHGLALTGATRETAEGLTADVHLDGLAAFVRRWAAEHSRMPATPQPAGAPGGPD